MTARQLDSERPPVLPSPEELFRTRAQFVWRVVTAHGVAVADAPDAAQEVFVIAFDKLGEFDASRGSLDTWLYGIAARVAANHRRKAHVRRETPGEPPDTADHADPGDGIDRARLLTRLDQALAAMEPAKRDVFVMFEIAGLTMHEIAHGAGCNLKTAYGRLYAARRELAAQFGSTVTGERGGLDGEA
jgi:RNA polymerase sigma-70 factor, ECF subfamily